MIRNEDLWFNWAPNTNKSMVMNVSNAPIQKVAVNTNKVLLNPTKSTNKNTTPKNVVYTDCTKCQGGYPVGGRVTNGDCSSLGAGWMAADPGTGFWIDPCMLIDSQKKAGCMDPSALNYNPNAVSDNGKCLFANPVPIPVPVEPVFGCTDPIAQNYNPAATDDDGNFCTYAQSTTEDDKQFIKGIDNQTLMYIGIGMAALLILKK